MSPAGWKRRLAKRGLILARLLEHGPGYVGDCVVSEWTALVEPTDRSRNDSRFRPLIGVGFHGNLDDAVKLAVADFDAKEEEQQRELAVLALAGELTLEDEQESLEQWRKLWRLAVVNKNLPAPPLTPQESALLERRLVADGLDGPHTRALRALRQKLR